MSGMLPLYRLPARNVLAIVGKLHANERSQKVSSALLQETHATGLQASLLRYLKTCHAR